MLWYQEGRYHMTDDFDDEFTPDDEPPAFTAVLRLSADLAKAAATMSADEARFLVDAYYAMQDNRIRAKGQVRAMSETEEPHAILQWLASQSGGLENQIKRALNSYSLAHPDGGWPRSIVGIGPVISAGLLAHIDIKQCPTVGHIWRYAGLDPTSEWKSSEYMRGFVKAARETHKDDWRAFIHVCFETKKHPLRILQQADAIAEIPEPWLIEDFLSKRKSNLVLKAEFSADNMLREALNEDELPIAYGQLMEEWFPDFKFKWADITKALTRRPHNASLKVLCWKIGESFVKFSGHPRCYYGHIYKKRKEYEIHNNVTGMLAEQAAAILTKKKFNKDTDAYKAYIQGLLPPAQIHARARRYAVKLFLAHLHHKMYERHFGKAPPLPYPIAHMGHVDFIPPPEGEAA